MICLVLLFGSSLNAKAEAGLIGAAFFLGAFAG